MHETAPRTVSRNFGALAMTLAAYAGAASSAHAQTGDSVLQGRVIAADTKAPIAEVIVTVRSRSLQGDQTVITDNSGFYRVANLPPGSYVVRFDKENHNSFERGQVQLRASTTLRVDGALVPDTVQGEEIYLVETPPTIDVGSSTVATTISSEMTKRVPLSRPGTKGGGTRSFENVAQAAPEARADAYGTSMAGTTSPENRLIIDGLAVNNTAYGIGSTPLSAEFIQEVNVVTGGYLPEYGRATGGVLNVVTKSGSNTFAGNAWSNVTPGFLEGSRRPLYRDGSTIRWDQPKIGYISDVGFDVAGPIVRDKLWFYAGFDYARSIYDIRRYLMQAWYDGMPITAPVGNGQAQIWNEIPGSESKSIAVSNAYQGILKLSYSPVRTHAFSLTSVAAPSSSGGNGNYGIDPDSGAIEPGTTAAGQYETLAGKYNSHAFDNLLKWTASSKGRKVVVDTTFGWHHEVRDDLPWDGSLPGSGRGLSAVPNVGFRRGRAVGNHPITDFESVPAGFCVEPDPMKATRCPLTTYSLGGPGAIRESKLDRYQLRSVFTTVANVLGHHVLKAGIDLEYVSYQLNKGYTGQNAYRESTDGRTFADVRNYNYLTGPDQLHVLPSLRTDTKAYSLGGFLQNSWSVMDKVTVNAGVRYDTQLLYNTWNRLGLTLPNQWSPRLGFIFDPTQRGRSRIFGSYARYYQNVPLDMADRALSGEPSAYSTRPAGACQLTDPNDQDTCRDPAKLTPLAGQPANPNQKYRASSGVTPVDPDLKASSVDEIVLGAEYEIIESRVGLTYSRRRLGSIIEDMSRDEGETYFIGNPGEGIASDFPRAVRDYDAFTLHFSRAFKARWLAQASYTLSWLRGNYSGLFRPETGQLDPNITSDFDLRSLLENRDGPLPGDRRHQLKLFTARDWAIGSRHLVLTGVGARASSGGPTNYLGYHPIYLFDEVFILERGSGPRLPWTYSVDLRLGYTFTFSREINLTATLDIFNVFNFQKATARDQRYTTANVLPVPGKRSEEDIRTYGRSTDYTRFDVDANKNLNFGNVTRTQEPTIVQLGVRASF